MEQKQWEVNGNKDHEWGFSATEAINGDFLITGQNTLNGYTQASVRKYDSKGNLLWDNEYGQLVGFSEQGSSIKTNIDNTFTILGKVANYEFEREDILLFKINSNGVILWSKTFGSDEDDWGITLLKNSSDINIITGEYKVKYESLGTKKGIKKTDGFLFITLVDSDGEFK